jgi:DMSO reductase family type II enzyme heme b subunit
MHQRSNSRWALLGAILAGTLACASGEPPVRAPLAPVVDGALVRGRELFATHCVVCHGPAGRGDGPAAYLLSPAPRDFGSTRFRIVSTENGVPTREDLVAVLKQGMPGSAMPPWEWLPPCDLARLADTVRELAIEGRTADLLRFAQEEEEEMTRAEALEIATSAMTPGAALALPPECSGEGDLVEGRRLFLRSCAQCHGADGTGSGASVQWNEDGTPAYPRDFTAGIFKGGSTHADIVRRLLIGLPGSSMPSTTFDDPRQAAQLAAYVQSLVRPGAQASVSQARRVLAARHVAGAVPTLPEDPAWNAIEGTWLALMPLWWNERRVPGCVVRAVHDGNTLAVKLSWEDATREDDFLATEDFTDAAALQWSRDANPPLFTMGETGRPVNIWQWKAAWERDLEEVRGVAARHPSTPPDQYGHTDAPSADLYLTARAAANPMAVAKRASAGEMLSAEGFGTLAPIRTPDGKLGARARWADGFWDLVLTRPLAACCPGELALEPGNRVSLALALWNGAASDRNGQKSVSVWHVLELEQVR